MSTTQSTGTISDSQAMACLLQENRTLLSQLAELQDRVGRQLLEGNSQQEILDSVNDRLQTVLNGKREAQQRLLDLRANYND